MDFKTPIIDFCKPGTNVFFVLVPGADTMRRSAPGTFASDGGLFLQGGPE